MWFSESIPVNIQSFNPDANLKKYVAFDLDYTLIKTKSGKKFPQNEDDWMWLNKNVPKKLEQFHNDGYHVIVVSNQSSKKVEDVANKVKQIFDKLSITATVFICYGDEYRKPNCRVINEHINPAFIEFYCGDACGRVGDFSNSDLLFAFNLGIKFLTPEDD
jgi:bifunctional polynucleotide phosphatase/kinase